MRSVTIELPDELAALLGSAGEAASNAREMLVLELLREARISQGVAARVLGLTRGEILDLMVARQIPSGPETEDEVREEFEAVRRYARQQEARASRQQQ